MPTQENEINKTEQIQPSQEEDLRKNIAKAQENNEHNSQKLLPFLNAKAEFHQSRIDTLDEKIASRQNKIAKNEAKIEKLSATADKLEDKNRMYKATMSNIPGIKLIIAKNEKKIQQIREEKIPKREAKIDAHKYRISQLTKKRDVISHKMNRVIALNDTIKSFSLGLNKERREIFSEALDRLNKSSADCLTDKKNTLEAEKSALMQQYDDPNTNVLAKIDLQNDITSLNKRISVLDSKIEKLSKSESLTKQPDIVVDKVIQETENKVNEAVQNDSISVPDVSDVVLTSAMKSMEQTLDSNYLKNAEMAVEDDYNMIDGIINNGSKEELEQNKNQLETEIQNMQKMMEGHFVSENVKTSLKADVDRMQNELAAVNSALAVFFTPVEENIEKKPEISKETVSKDNIVKINPDFYQTIAYDDRRIETMNNIQADKVISMLENAGIMYSAAKREDSTSITVYKTDQRLFKEMIEKAYQEMECESKAVWHQLGDAFVEAYEERQMPDNSDKKPVTKAINSDYFKSLTKDNRSINVETAEVGKAVMEKLDDMGIKYSAVERKNNSIAITVSKADEQAYKNVSDNAKTERAVKFVNPDFFKSLPKEERATQRMPQDKAEMKMQELDGKGIPYSAVLNGDKSAVTVEKKNTQAVYMSRNALKREAQKIHNRGKKQKFQAKSKNQGLEQ